MTPALFTRSLAALLLVGSCVFAQPATRPAVGGPPILERIEMALQNLKLTDEQKTKIDTILADARQRLGSMRGELQDLEPPQRMQKLAPLMQQVRDDLLAVLDNDQKAQLERRMDQFRQRMREQRGGAARGQQPRSAPSDDPRMSDTTMSDTMTSDTMMDEKAGRQPDGSSAPPADEPIPAGPEIGDAAPALKLQRLDGGVFDLGGTKGRVTVLVFGSLSCPSFRQRAAALEKLRLDYGTRASVFIVYTKEAHPLGEWEVSRNKDEGIAIEQPRNIDARRGLATKARDGLRLGGPILLDTMENDAARAYGAGANSACVIARDGTIAARQRWFEPAALRRAIDKAVAARSSASAE